MTDHPALSTLSIRGTPLLECQRVDISPHLRVYYRPFDDGHGFDFFIAEFAGGYTLPADGQSDMDLPDTEVECLFHGVAYYDGLRHLYMGSEASDNVGYLYYANPVEMAKVFTALAELEARYCPHADRRVSA